MRYKLKVKLEGYDAFFGMCNDDNEFFIILDGNNYYNAKHSLEHICDVLCDYVRDGKKILLNKSPGKIVRCNILSRKIITLEPFNEDQMKELEKMYEMRKDVKLFPNPFLYQPEESEVS